jgi:putative transposase
LGDLSERFNIEVYAYVLMGNHYHLLLKTIDANLSKAMQWFGTSYTSKFNLSNQLGGHLFQGRFKSIIIQNDAYLLRLSCYIHRNPLRAGIVERLADYRWSSYRCYGYGKKPLDWLKTGIILNQLHCQDPHKAYRIKVQQYSGEEGSLWEDVKHGLIYGGHEFVEDIKTRFLDDKKDVELPQRNRLLKTINSELLLEKASKLLDFEIELVRGNKKISHDDKENRDMLAFLLWKTGRLSNQEIGSYFNLTYSSISKIVSNFNNRLHAEKMLKSKFDKLNSQFKV